jgi:hypothetical protein
MTLVQGLRRSERQADWGTAHQAGRTSGPGWGSCSPPVLCAGQLRRGSGDLRTQIAGIGTVLAEAA